jgi:transcriptional regulator with XRE-family HTH domain
MLAELVRTHRQRLGMTQEDLAKASRLSVRTVRHIEGARAARPRLSTICLLADALELSGAARTEFQDAALVPVPPGHQPARPGTPTRGSTYRCGWRHR